MNAKVLLATPAAVAFLLAAPFDVQALLRDAKSAAARPDPETAARRASLRELRMRLSLDPNGPVNIDRLAAALRDADAQVRGEAVLALGKTGSRGLPRVIGALRDSDPSVRRKAIRALRWAGSGGDGAVSAIASAVADAEPTVRRDALQALLDLGDAGAPELPAVRSALADSDEISRNLAVDVLRGLGPRAIPVLREALSAGDRGVRGRSARILGALGDGSQGVLIALEATARDPREDGWVRHEATRAAEAIRLRSTGRPPSADDVATLLESLKEPVLTDERKAAVIAAFRALEKTIPPEERREARASIPDDRQIALYEAAMGRERREKVASSIARAGAEAEARLLVATRSAEPEVRACALLALSKIGRTGPGALSAPGAALRDPEPVVRSAGVKAIATMGERAEELVADLAAMLGDPDPAIRREALEAVGTVDPTGRRSVAAIVRTLDDPEQEVRGTAVATLSGMAWRSDEATPRILESLPRDEAGAPGASSRAVLLEKLGPQAIPLLLSRFERDPRPSTAAALGQFGAWAGEAVPALEKGLKSGDPELRKECVAALGRIGPRAKAAIPELARLLEDPVPLVRPRVPWALVRIGPDSPDALRALARSLKEYPGRGDREDALVAAGAPAVPYLAEALAEGDPDSRQRAAGALGRIGRRSGDAVPALLAALDDEDPDVRVSAVKALDAIGFDAGGVLPRLLEIAKSRNDVFVRAWSARAIGTLGADGAAAVPALLEILARKTDTPSTHDALYHASLEALARTAPGAARPVIAKALKSRDASWRVRAARIFIELDPEAGEAGARPVLLRSLDERDERVRIAAALAILERESSSTAALRALASGVRAREQGEAISAALQRAGPVAVPHLVEIFETGDSGNRKAAAAILGRLGPAAAGAVPALVGALEDDDDALAGVAARTLGAIGPPARAAVPALSDPLRGRSGPLASYAAEALGGIGPGAVSAVPALRHALGSSNYITADSAARALGKIGPAAADAVPDLVAALGGGGAPNGAVEALGNIGRADSRLVIPMLDGQGDPAPRRRVFCAVARLAADPGNGEALSVLENLMENGCEAERLALHDIDPKALGLGGAGALSRLLERGTRGVKMQAALLLRKLGAGAREAVPILAEGVRDPDPRIRESFIATLREIGPAARDAVPALKEALGDWRASIRWSAYDALAAIDPDSAPPILRP